MRLDGWAQWDANDLFPLTPVNALLLILVICVVSAIITYVLIRRSHEALEDSRGFREDSDESRSSTEAGGGSSAA